eukprot:107987-Hanusia_phi.AAC.1
MDSSRDSCVLCGLEAIICVLLYKKKEDLYSRPGQGTGPPSPAAASSPSSSSYSTFSAAEAPTRCHRIPAAA